MDVNGVPYLALLERAELLPEGDGFAWNGTERHVRLARADAPRLPLRDLTAQRRPAPPAAVDPSGQVARIGGAVDARESGRWVEVRVDAGLPSERSEPLRWAQRITTDASGHERSEIPVDADAAVVAPPGVATFRDLALGAGLLALVSSDGNSSTLQVYDLRRRSLVQVELPDVPLRVAIDASGRVLVLAATRLMTLWGAPLPQPFQPAPDVFRPERDNPMPLGLVAEQLLPPGLSGVALSATGPRLWLLAEDALQNQLLLGQASDGAFVRLPLPTGLPWFADLAPIGDAIAFLAWPAAADPPRRDAWLASAQLTPLPRLVPRAGRHPLHQLGSARFTTAAPSGPRYLSDQGPALLAPLPQPQFQARASGVIAAPLDSGEPGCIWHRLVLEASVPEGCAVEIEVRSAELESELGSAAWLPQPPLGWVPQGELPWHAGLLPAQPGRSGHFELLLQQPVGNVRRVVGRYLQLRLTLSGDGRHSPSLAAMRVHYRRFSYQEQHLPGVYRQQETFEPGSGPANGADVRERFFAALEGMLTPIEGRIALGEWLVDPYTAPRALLPQIARFTGLELDPTWPEARQRRLLAEAGRLQQLRGTPRGVALALDIASDGGVSRGQVLLVENFRLRRTMATLLGVRIDDRDHPLTLGSMPEGNSIVGDSLILSEASARAFLALLDDHGASDAAAVARFFDRHAHQVSVILHGAARGAREQIERALARFAPAQVRYRILVSDAPFVLGLSPLLAIDTSLQAEPAPEAVTLGASLLGRSDLVQNGLAFIPALAPE